MRYCVTIMSRRRLGTVEICTSYIDGATQHPLQLYRLTPEFEKFMTFARRRPRPLAA